ncbi:hypothetical protein [Arthrobacter sp. C9C5]|uniref:hypothetical protein n=1 Tax=Arthrobacter sp. C9C5 TaxID=2735267 RepID=UPI0015848C9D|nr:hypothetical protein [Arthrobacter sp. C9C5]NUU30837.1 hypothetical protein [Arthrobacter sp. C9C5]
MTSRRLARRDAIAPIVEISQDPNRVVQQSLDSPRGKVRAWFKGGACYRVRIAGTVYGWGEGPSVWASVLDGSFRPHDFGKHNS